MLSIVVENRINQFNPWLTYPERAKDFLDRFLPPEYVHRDAEKLPILPDRALLVVGPRQSGKSTMIWHLLRRFIPDILFLNMEDPLIRTGCIYPLDFVELVQNKYRFINAIFIDEIQHMEEAGLFVKGIVDAKMNLPVLVTGSSSFHLRSKTRESLAGRAGRRLLMPFGMEEILSHLNPPNPVSERKMTEEIFSHQVIFGSYPSIYLARGHDEKRMLLNDLVEALILRDASDLYKIKRIDALWKLLALLAGQIGNLINLSELASICNVDVGTVNAYIEILDESYVIKKITPFAGGRRREITSSPKVFFVDNGIRNQLINNFSNELDLRTDKGQLLENWVFSEISKVLPLQSSLKFWRSKAKAEVDFIVEHTGKIYPIEVKYSSLKTPRLSRSAWSFIEAYKPENFAVLNITLEKSITSKNTRIDFITPHSLSRWIRNILGTKTPIFYS